jgi:hypothetical protein
MIATASPVRPAAGARAGRCWTCSSTARGLALIPMEHRQLAQMRAARMAQTPESLTA